MSNDPAEKQPPASPPEGSPTAQARPEPPEEEFPSDLDWQLRAHPVIEKTRAPAEEAVPGKKEVPAAATAKPAAPTPPKPPAPPAPAATGATAQKPEVPAAAPPKPVPSAPATPPAPPPADKVADAVPPAGGETKPAAPAAPPAAAPPKPAAAVPPKAPAAGPPKEAPPKPLDNELVKRYRSRFGNAIREAWLDRKQ